MAGRFHEEAMRWRAELDDSQFQAASKRMRKTMHGTQRGGNKTGQVFTQMSYALDDVQYGFRGVQNNLQQIAVQAGASGPVVLGITAIAVALNYVIEHWDEFGDKASKALDKVEQGILKNQDAVANLLLETKTEELRLLAV